MTGLTADSDTVMLLTLSQLTSSKCQQSAQEPEQKLQPHRAHQYYHVSIKCFLILHATENSNAYHSFPGH